MSNNVSMMAVLRVFYNQELKVMMDKKKVEWLDALCQYAFDRRFRAVPFGHLTHGGMDVLQFVPRDGVLDTRLLISYQSPVEGAVSLYVLQGPDTPVDQAVRVVTVPTRVLPGPQRQKAFCVLPIVRWMLQLATSDTTTA